MKQICEGLQFPEGPIAMADGSIILVEIKRGTLSRVSPSGEISVVAECGGGPNGAAIGPDGRVYVCNNGGFVWEVIDGLTRPTGTPDSYTGGSIQAVDIATGEVEVLYTHYGDKKLKGPNDIIFDEHGGFYFTDLGKRHDESLDRGAVYYATTDGKHIDEIVHPIEQPNGIALSPDGSRLYVAQTFSANLMYWDIVSPGRLKPHSDPFGVGSLLYRFRNLERLDSMAVDRDGNVCVATLGSGCVTAISPAGELIARMPVPKADVMVTNICFGGTDNQTAFITSSGQGILYEAHWHCPGHPLYFNA